MPSPVIKGQAAIHGINGTITGLLLQSYTLTETYNGKEEIVGQDGVVVGIRYFDKRISFSGEGVVPSTYSYAAGDNLNFSGNVKTFSGAIESVEERGEARGAMRVSISAVDYEGVSY